MSAPMHISERLMHLMRALDDVKVEAERAPKEIRYTIELAAEQQIALLRDVMSSAWTTISYLQSIIRDAAKAERDARVEQSPAICNQPFERVPQHAADPGFGPVPPPPDPKIAHIGQNTPEDERDGKA